MECLKFVSNPDVPSGGAEGRPGKSIVEMLKQKCIFVNYCRIYLSKIIYKYDISVVEVIDLLN